VKVILGKVGNSSNPEKNQDRLGDLLAGRSPGERGTKKFSGSFRQVSYLARGTFTGRDKASDLARPINRKIPVPVHDLGPEVHWEVGHTRYKKPRSPRKRPFHCRANPIQVIWNDDCPDKGVMGAGLGTGFELRQNLKSKVFEKDCPGWTRLSYVRCQPAARTIAQLPGKYGKGQSQFGAVAQLGER
jgi:hypothetical protein